VYCPTHPKTRRIVADIVRELLDIYEPRQFHIGHDEIQFAGREQARRCMPALPRTETARGFRVRRGRDFMDNSRPRESVPGCGATWSPRRNSSAEFTANANGLDGEVYRALDLLPRDIVIADWTTTPARITDHRLIS